MSLFSIFYYLLALVLYILFIPYLLLKSRNKKYKDAIPAKFFLKNNDSFKNSDIWFHSCSLGETKTIKPFFEKFKDANLSVITNTGFEEGSKFTKNIRYLPFEIFLPFWIKKQKVLVVMEAELWFMLFLVAKQKGAKTILINARISDKSYKSYKRFSFFYKKVFKNIDKIFAQSELDKKRLEELGAKNIEVNGNIKLAQVPKINNKFDKNDNTIITLASSHDKEEELVLECFDKSQGKLLIVPRHPERFEFVETLIKDYVKDKDITFHKFSEKEDFSSDIILVDKMGILNDIYAISDVVILGGAFEKIGGHNPVEPAYFGCKIISGKHIFNQKSLFECIENYYIIEKEDLKGYLDKHNNLKKPILAKSGSIEPIIKEINGNR